jgi:hypothetical protein
MHYQQEGVAVDNSRPLLLERLAVLAADLLLALAALGLYAWLSPIFLALYRLGRGLSRRNIAILARGDNLRRLESLLLDSRLFSRQRLILVPDESRLDLATRGHLLLLAWEDWGGQLEEVLRRKGERAALVIYAPPGTIPPEQLKRIDGERHAVVANFRGRLLNDIVVSLITTTFA